MQSNLPDPREGSKPRPAGDYVLAPYFGPVARTDWHPTVPGAQPHNAGVTPTFARRDRRSVRYHPTERLAKVECQLAEALARLAVLECKGVGP
jgi:hypothetical protein